MRVKPRRKSHLNSFSKPSDLKGKIKSGETSSPWMCDWCTSSHGWREPALAGASGQWPRSAVQLPGPKLNSPTQLFSFPSQACSPAWTSLVGLHPSRHEIEKKEGHNFSCTQKVILGICKLWGGKGWPLSNGKISHSYLLPQPPHLDATGL